MDDEATRDRSHCLTTDQLLALRATAPGAMPAEVAAHLASCERCQRQALFGAEGAVGRRPKEAPSLGKAFLRVAMVLVALIMFLASIRILLG